MRTDCRSSGTRQLNSRAGSGRQPDPIPYRRLAAAALLAAMVIPDRRLESAPVFCPFRRATGLPCPTCGLSRSWIALLHGRPRASFSFHPLGPLTVVAALVVLEGAGPAPELTARLRSRRPLGTAIAVWLGVWLVRLRAARRSHI